MKDFLIRYDEYELSKWTWGMVIFAFGVFVAGLFL